MWDICAMRKTDLIGLMAYRQSISGHYFIAKNRSIAKFFLHKFLGTVFRCSEARICNRLLLKVIRLLTKESTCTPFAQFKETMRLLKRPGGETSPLRFRRAPSNPKPVDKVLPCQPGDARDTAGEYRSIGRGVRRLGSRA